MADLEKTVSIVFKGVDDLSKTMNTVSRNVETFAGNIQDATQPMADMAEKVLKIEAVLSALAIGGLAYAVKEAGAFNDAFNEISTLITATGGDFETFKQQILDYATESTASIEDVNAAVYTAISAGIEYKDSLELLTQAEKLSVAGKADLESTTKVLVSTLNAYGQSTDEASRFSDVLFTTVRKGQTTLPELSTSLAQVTGVAAAADVPFETLAASIAALTASGAPTTQAITQIKAAISNIIKPSSEAEKAAEALGIGFNAAALKSKGFEGVLLEVYEATGGNIDQMAKFFGSVEGLNAALVLGADRGGKFADTLDEMKNSAGTTEAEFQKMADNLKLVVQNLVNNFRAILIDFGTPFLDETTDIARGVSEVFQGIRVGIDEGAFDPVFQSLEKFGQKIAEDLLKIAEIMPEALEQVDFEVLVKSFENLGQSVSDVFSALFGGIDLTTPEGLARAIQKIVDAIAALTDIAAGIVNAWEPFIGLIGDAIDKFSSADESTHSLIGNILGLGQAINKATGLLSGFAGVLGSVASGMTALAAIKYLGIASGLGSIALALGPLALGGAVALGIGYIGAKIIDELIPAMDKIPEKKEIVIELDDGAVLDVIKGVVRTAEGEEITLQAYIDPSGLLDGIPNNTPQVIKDLLRTGEADVLINYVANPNLDTLEQAIRDAGGIIIKQTQDQIEGALKPITDLPKKIEPLELIDVDDTKIRLEEIKAKADIVQTAMEWSAKIDMAQIDADTKRIEASFESIGVSIESSGETLASLFDTLAGGDLGLSDWKLLQKSIEQEMDLRKKSFDMQEGLIKQQTEYLKLKNEAIKRGDALIQIDGAGLQPHLEAFMWEILEAIQVRASEEGAEFLLGIT